MSTVTRTKMVQAVGIKNQTRATERVVKDNVKLTGPAKRTIIGKNVGSYARPSQREAPQTKEHSVLTVIKSGSSIKRAGNYILGPQQGNSPVKCIKQYVARKDGSDQFYVLKILTRKNVGERETPDDIQGKTLLHTEHSLLSLVKDQEGVSHEHGMFRETVKETFLDEKGDEYVKDVRIHCLVLDCFVAHDFSPKFSNITNMQCYVIKEKKLPEAEAIRIFCKVVRIVESLHKLNIVHRDLKLGNIIVNKDSHEVKLANFCLGKHLSSSNDLLKDQRGSPGKPSDMWALGVVLYTMLFGQFPFYDESPVELFGKIKKGEFQIPVDVNVSDKTIQLIKELLVVDPKKRLTVSETLMKVKSVIADEESLMTSSDLQVVPDWSAGNERPSKRKFSKCDTSPSDFAADIAYILGKCDELPEFMLQDSGPEKKKIKTTKLPDLINQYTLDDKQLLRIHAMYIARKIAEATSNGTLSAQKVTEELENQVSSR